MKTPKHRFSCCQALAPVFKDLAIKLGVKAGCVLSLGSSAPIVLTFVSQIMLLRFT